ncbi:MAG: hypothetical protein EBR10_01615 [Planctomycetes bacterium]|nr:hypothetical protein [Planctomycetota bacterium]
MTPHVRHAHPYARGVLRSRFNLLHAVIHAAVAAMSATALAASLHAVVAAPTARVDPPANAPIAAKRNLYERIVIVGASASDGFGVFLHPTEATATGEAAAAPTAPSKAPPIGVSLAMILRQAGAQPASASPDAREPTTAAILPTIRHFTSGFFFANPGPIARSEVNRAIDAQPTLVLALDYLFWFAYGTVNANGEPMRDAAQRLENLELGLQQLQRIIDAGAPIVVGDIPDMRESIGRMLSKAQVPDADTIARANERIQAWIREHPSTRLLRLSEIQTKLRERMPVQLGGREWTSTDTTPLLQDDQLHPTFVGTVAIASALIDTARAFDGDGPAPFTFNPADIRSRILESKSAATPRQSVRESSPSTP